MRQGLSRATQSGAILDKNMLEDSGSVCLLANRARANMSANTSAAFDPNQCGRDRSLVSGQTINGDRNSLPLPSCSQSPRLGMTLARIAVAGISAARSALSLLRRSIRNRLRDGHPTRSALQDLAAGLKPAPNCADVRHGSATGRAKGRVVILRW
jgi:hypothetical protein